MTRFEKIKAMSVEEMAQVIMDKYSEIFGDEYCNSDCGTDDGCPHEKDCCINWLNSDI